jgi:hypothetical protein
MKTVLDTLKITIEHYIANRGQTFRIRHFENSQTPSSGRNRYDVISAIVKGL